MTRTPFNRIRNLIIALPLLAVLALLVSACGGSHVEKVSGGQTGTYVVPAGIHKIKHVIIIQQENRSFDSYFGTFPGADGIPMKNGTPTVCLPDPRTGHCVQPYVDHADINGGGPHSAQNATADVDRGKMDGFIAQAESGRKGCLNPYDPACSNSAKPDVMGYHSESDIPNYWDYAKQFVLQDHMFEPNASWSLPSHLFLVSEWSAYCTKHNQPSTCTSALQTESDERPPNTPAYYGGKTGGAGQPIYAWTDLTDLLYKNKVSWGYYVVPGSEPDCENDAALTCAPVKQGAQTPGIWNPLPWFDTVKADHQLGNVQSINRFYAAAKSGTLPAVSWVVPSGALSEHPPAPISYGQSYVTSLINAVMRSPDWNSTAIFVSWDDWGGFYDHVKPPKVDQNGYGLCVPGIVISPYAKRGYVDHQTLSFDAYDKFIEDDFLGGQRLDPRTDGRPDPRPDVRENEKILGDLSNDFDFTQKPRTPLTLPVHPKTTLQLTRAAAPAPPPAKRGSRGDQLAPLISCLSKHGFTLPKNPTAKGVRQAFLALPKARQQSLFAACSATLPPSLRQRIEALLGTSGQGGTP